VLVEWFLTAQQPQQPFKQQLSKEMPFKQQLSTLLDPSGFRRLKNTRNNPMFPNGLNTGVLEPSGHPENV
jgi:hypothetical protein